MITESLEHASLDITQKDGWLDMLIEYLNLYTLYSIDLHKKDKYAHNQYSNINMLQCK